MRHEDEDFGTEQARNDAALAMWSVVDCNDRCSGWILSSSDTWVRCRGCNRLGTVPHPEAEDDVSFAFVVTVEGHAVFRCSDRPAAADMARCFRDLGKATRLRRVATTLTHH